MKLLGSTKSKITKDKNSENMPYLEIVELVLIHCNVQNSRVLHQFVPNKSFGQLLDILPENIFLKTFDPEIQYANPLEIENKINIAFFIN